MIVKSIKNQKIIADKCFVAESFLDRFRGLIGKPKLSPGEGMLFPHCNSIHMWFMRFSIDVIFLKREQDGVEVRVRVSSVHEGVRPWRFFPLMDFSGSDTLELPSGVARQCGIVAGDEVCLS